MIPLWLLTADTREADVRGVDVDYLKTQDKEDMGQGVDGWERAGERVQKERIRWYD